MSKEEAATIYLDNRLGFHGGFLEFQKAERILFEQKKRLIQMTVSGIGSEKHFFSQLIENDNQHQKGE